MNTIWGHFFALVCGFITQDLFQFMMFFSHNNSFLFFTDIISMFCLFLSERTAAVNVTGSSKRMAKKEFVYLPLKIYIISMILISFVDIFLLSLTSLESEFAMSKVR